MLDTPEIKRVLLNTCLNSPDLNSLVSNYNTTKAVFLSILLLSCDILTFSSVSDCIDLLTL